MKAISYYYTKNQFMARKKDVTRRKRCGFQPGEHYNAVNQMQGLKKGEKRQVLGECECLSNVPERVDEIVRRPVRVCVTEEEFASARLCCRHYWQIPGTNTTDCSHCGMDRNYGWPYCARLNCPGIAEVDREGFPELSPEQFAEMLKKMNHLTDRDIVQRVVFRRVD